MSEPAYFLNHSIGQYPGKAADMAAATAAFARLWGGGDDCQWPQALAARSAFISLWQDLIDAPAGTLTTTESVTTGLYTVLGALPPEMLNGRRVLVSADCFPSLHFLLAGLAARRGFRLETVPLRSGESWVREDDLIARLGPDVAVTLVTLVTSTAGYRADLDALLPAIRRCGSLVVLDLTQGIGVVPISLATLCADIVVSTSLKWLCGAPGAGILQVGASTCCKPVRRNCGAGSASPIRSPGIWMVLPMPTMPGVSTPEHRPRWRPSRRCPDCVGRPGRAGRSCWIMRRVWVMPSWMTHGPWVLTPAAPVAHARRGGSVMLRLPGDCDPRTVVAGLRAAEVYADARGGILRLSPGATTTIRDVDRLMSSLRDLL